MATPSSAKPLDRGTYELLRERLRGHGRELAARVEKVNAARKATFGGVEPQLVATERVTTAHSCVPRDMAAAGDVLLFGFNVQFGLKAERAPADVFAAYTFSENRFHPRPLDVLADAAFEKDFKEVYRYYKNASFAKFVSRGPLLYMQFRTGAGEADLKTFKWAADGGTLRYVDNRSDHEVSLPAQYDFEWRRPRREDHVPGRHPHINIADKVFVETIGGDLTVKIENNTETGEGIYSEPVENADQTLDDAEIRFATLSSLVVLRIRPYQEGSERHIVYCEKTRKAVRLDGIAQTCRLLPADQGVIYPSGYLLHTGDGKTFEGVPRGAKFEQRIDAPNGEDFLYIFYDAREGLYVLVRYNLIAQTADAPLLCHGYTLFPGGELVCFRTQPDPQRHHAIQIWQTPFSAESLLPQADSSSELFKIGNREIVAGLSECREILTLLHKDDSYGDLYGEVAGRAGDLLDSYYWIRSAATLRLDEPLEEIRGAANAAIEEYEKVAHARETARRQTEGLARRVEEAIATAHRRRFEAVGEFTETLAGLRTLRGEVIGLRDVRYTDPETLSKLEETLKAESEKIAVRCVAFLDGPEALAPIGNALATERGRLGEINTARDAKEADARVAAKAGELELLIETVSNLPIEDATQRTRVVDSISAIFATVNALRAEVRNRRKELARTEGTAEFGSQLKLLGQAVVNSLERCDSPERCDEQFSRLLLQVEELEGQFADFDEFAVALAEKREEIASAFETRKTSLLEARAKRIDSLAAAADRLLTGIGSRAKTLDGADAIHGYFAGDLTVGKVRDLAGQLAALGDAVRGDGLLTRLKSLHDDAVRLLRDRQDLFAEGPGVINLGGHRFSVNTEPVDLTTVVRDGALHLHLTGTRFYEALDDPELLSARDCWDQQFVSETDEVYRGEYLAWSLFEEARRAGTLTDIMGLDEAGLVAWVAERMAPRYAEGYLKGVHDRDAAAILKTLAELDGALGPLRTTPKSRALARLFWEHACAGRAKDRLASRLVSLREFAAIWPERVDLSGLRQDLEDALQGFASHAGRSFDAADCRGAADFLASELLASDTLAVSRNAVELAAGLRQELRARGAEGRFQRALEAAGEDIVARFETARRWLIAARSGNAGGTVVSGTSTPEAGAVTSAAGAKRTRKKKRAKGVEVIPSLPAPLLSETGTGSTASVGDTRVELSRGSVFDEAAVLLLEGGEAGAAIEAESVRELSGMLGEHPRIQNGRYRLDFHDFFERLARHDREAVPKFKRFVERKHGAIGRAREELRLEEFKPRVMASFVRNRLIDAAYLPLIGANLAKQIGVAGSQTRADRQGMLLLVSPPGYGKTTLMEYVADRLGLVFLKVNGPAIGHAVTSLDPAAAPNLAAREELEKLNLGFEIGDNVMLYVDDIQHCHPEFLQKFISLCDAQRKIEGVWRGGAKTYDFRGRKVAVVMAGNPYTESGEKFRLPDMLANRADVYNLGDVIGRNRGEFELSFLENALTSNTMLSRLAGRQQDALAVVGLAAGKDPSSVTLEGNFAAGELDAMGSVMRKLLRVRDVVLTVNAEYIRSAAQADEFRTEPPFKLQGSYRNMNRIAEKVLPAMNDAELDELIWSSYRNEAQTLTTGAEANLLKFRELVGWLTPDEAKRWAEIQQTFRRNQKLRGVDQSDRFGQAVAQLSLFAEGLSELRTTLADGIERLGERSAAPAPANEASAIVAERLEAVREVLAGLSASVGDGLGRLCTTESRPDGHHVTIDPDSLRQIIEALGSRAPAARVDGQESAAASLPASITVVNRIPPTLLNVLREQFRLMEAWLKPVLAASQRQSDEMAELSERIRACLADYERLVSRVEATRGDGVGS